MNFDDRVKAVAEFGFSTRQARFLVNVMLHAGVCVPRQYATFAGTAYDHNVTKFFDRLLQRRYATVCRCLHNRAELYHVRHQPLYRAIGQPRSRYRRPVSGRLAIDRLVLLDAIVTSPDLFWLSSVEEKVAFCNLMAPALPSERLPHVTVGTTPPRVRLFPEDLPIGVSSTGRVVFLYLVTTPFDPDLRGFLQRHRDLLAALPGWTVRLLFPPDRRDLIPANEKAACEELTQRHPPDTIAEFRWYCEQRRATSDPRAHGHSDARFWQTGWAFDTPRFRLLYRRCLTDGDTVFDLISSPAIAEALERGTGRIESQVLLSSYRHLVPLVAPGSPSAGVEEGEHSPAQPQPLSPQS
jgi:hypothetical protein